MPEQKPGRSDRLVTHYDPKNPSGHPSAEEAHDALLEGEANEMVRRAEENTYEGLVALFKRTDFTIKDVIKAYDEARTSKNNLTQGKEELIEMERKRRREWDAFISKVK